MIKLLICFLLLTSSVFAEEIKNYKIKPYTFKHDDSKGFIVEVPISPWCFPNREVPYKFDLKCFNDISYYELMVARIKPRKLEFEKIIASHNIDYDKVTITQKPLKKRIENFTVELFFSRKSRLSRS